MQLHKGEVTTVPLSECNDIYLEYDKQQDKSTIFRNGIDESQYCARDPRRKFDVCEGDSGMYYFK